jgi:MFS family permease
MLRYAARLLRTEPEVLALSFARMADALGNSLLIILLPLYIAEQPSTLLDLPLEAQVGLVVSLYGFLFAFSQPFMGWATDRAGRRKPFILAGLVIMLLATLGFIFARSYFWIVVLRCLQGVGVAMIIPSVLALIAAVTEKRTRGNAMGVYSTFRMVGFATGPLLGGLLHTYFGFNTAFLVGAAFLVVALLLVHFVVAEAPVEEVELGPAEIRVAEEGVGPRTRGAKGPFHLPSSTTLALMTATIVMACSLSMIAALETEFNERLSQTALGFGMAFSALTVARLFVQIPVGRLSDRIGRKKLIVGGLVALAPLTVLFSYVGTTVELINVRLLQGVATAFIAAPAFALAADLARKGGEGKEMSFLTMGFGLGMGVGPLIAGILGGYLGFAVPFYVVGALSLVAAGMVGVWAEESIKPQESSVPSSS